VEYWLVTSEFSPFHGGGIATYSEAVSKIQSKLFSRVRVFTQNSAGTDRVETRGNLEIHRISIRKWSDPDLLASAADVPSAMFNYINQKLLLESARPVMEITDWGGIGYFILEEKKNFNPLFQFTIFLSSHGPNTYLKQHNNQLDKTLESSLLEKMEYEQYGMADFVIFPTNFARQAILDSVPTLILEKTNIINYPIEINTPFNRKEEKQNRINILFFGRKQHLKGFDLFIEAMKSERFTNSDIHVLGGDSWFYAERKFGSRILTDSKLRITDWGLRTPAVAYAILVRAKVVVIASRIEWYSYAFIEAVSAGATVVIPDGTGVSELANHISAKQFVTFALGSSHSLENYC
jgi:glycogen synthase